MALIQSLPADPGLLRELVESGGALGILAVVCLSLVTAFVLLTRFMVKTLAKVLLDTLATRDLDSQPLTSYSPDGDSRNSKGESDDTNGSRRKGTRSRGYSKD